MYMYAATICFTEKNIPLNTVYNNSQCTTFNDGLPLYLE
jgi:hypothetical protein